MKELDNKERTKIYNAEYHRKNREKRNAYHTKYRLENKESINKKQAEYRISNVDRARLCKAVYRADNPDKIKASGAIQRAVREGKIKPLPCKVCGDTKVDGHHPDYSKPLSVIWLCRLHHKRLHFNRDNNGVTFSSDLKIIRQTG